MKAIEFTTEIRDGVIEMPLEYKQTAQRSARVIVLTEEKEEKLRQDKEAIRSILQEIKAKKVFKNIEDPVAWQKAVRDEWS